MPVGTILAYTGLLEKIPDGWALCNGENGTPDLRGRFLQSYSDLVAVTTFVEAGLPNITGKTYITRANITSSYPSSGALWTSNNGPSDSSYTFNERGFSLNFNAAYSNPIYGASDTVQPPSYIVYYIIKIK